jgi:hypothetical protein
MRDRDCSEVRFPMMVARCSLMDRGRSEARCCPTARCYPSACCYPMERHSPLVRQRVVQVSLRAAEGARSNPEPSHNDPRRRGATLLLLLLRRDNMARNNMARDNAARHSIVDGPNFAWRRMETAWGGVRGSCFGFVCCGKLSQEFIRGELTRDRVTFSDGMETLRGEFRLAWPCKT